MAFYGRVAYFDIICFSVMLRYVRSYAVFEKSSPTGQSGQLFVLPRYCPLVAQSEPAKLPYSDVLVAGCYVRQNGWEWSYART